MRLLVDLPKDQTRKLDRIKAKRHVSRAELIRQAVAQFLSRELAPEADAAFGLWKQRPEDGRAYQERVRGEWDER
jgi:predicted transcriptional regulator